LRDYLFTVSFNWVEIYGEADKQWFPVIVGA